MQRAPMIYFLTMTANNSTYNLLPVTNFCYTSIVLGCTSVS
ncbi:MAG: hypothetical protein JWQ38_2981 [Flavipsychrobacter sp.]|nr:hypothetical protein [Flavipsychrobacter sp.]